MLDQLKGLFPMKALELSRPDALHNLSLLSLVTAYGHPALLVCHPGSTCSCTCI